MLTKSRYPAHSIIKLVDTFRGGFRVIFIHPNGRTSDYLIHCDNHPERIDRLKLKYLSINSCLLFLTTKIGLILENKPLDVKVKVTKLLNSCANILSRKKHIFWVDPIKHSINTNVSLIDVFNKDKQYLEMILVSFVDKWIDHMKLGRETTSMDSYVPAEDNDKDCTDFSSLNKSLSDIIQSVSKNNNICDISLPTQPSFKKDTDGLDHNTNKSSESVSPIKKILLDRKDANNVTHNTNKLSEYVLPIKKRQLNIDDDRIVKKQKPSTHEKSTIFLKKLEIGLINKKIYELNEKELTMRKDMYDHIKIMQDTEDKLTVITSQLDDIDKELSVLLKRKYELETTDDK